MIKSLVPLIFIGLFATSCIQIPLGDSEKESYKKIKYNAPKNFSPLKATNSDQAWINNTNGNIISYRTECPSQVRSINNHFESISSDFLNSKIHSRDNFQYNNRQALRFKFSGDLESITTNYDLVGFKKFGCLFIITHNGREGALNQTNKDFESFLASFKVIK